MYLDGANLNVGDESGDRRQRDARLAERGQDVLDVVKEERVGTDDEHALTFERRAMREQEIGRAVQRHGGLAGARATLDQQHTGQGTSNDLVLFALNRGDDVTHAARACSPEGRQERPRSPEGETPFDESLFGRRAHGVLGQVQVALGVGEVFVLDPGDLVGVNGDVATSRQSE